MSDSPLLVLRVGGHEYAGWTSIQIVRSLDALADTFDLGLVTRGSSEPTPHDMAEGDSCQVIYDGEVLIDGWIDAISEGYDSTSSTLTISGRSRAGDLVDCSAVHKPWRSTPILSIASDLCRRFGITVSSDVPDLPVERYFKLTDGETVFAALDRLARDHGMRIISKPDGSVVFTRAGQLRQVGVAIERGVNVVSANFKRSMEERHSPYIFKAQLAASAEVNGAAASAKYELVDEGVDRYRPLVVEVEGQRGAATLQAAAAWERNTRAGKARALNYDVVNPSNPSRSWENAAGLWVTNAIVTVRDTYYKIDGEFLVAEVRFVLDSSGTRTSLRLTAPEAYEPKKPPKKKKKKGYSW